MIISEKDYLKHYGILRRSGRYPWGSGGPENVSSNPAKRNKQFLDHVADLRRQGLSEVEIARGMGITTTELRGAKAIAKNQQKQAQIGEAQRYKDKGMSNIAIGERMGLNESSVRALLAPGEKDKVDVLHSVSNMLKEHADKKTYVDVGAGVEHYVGVSRQKLDTALAVLKDQGYSVHRVKHPQLGTGHDTDMKILVPPGVTQKQVWMNRDKIQQITEYSNDGGRSFLGLHPPLNVDSKRIAVNYKENGGDKADGVIYVRPGVDDLSLGASRYAQVRIAVDGTHYLKGMAMYKDNLPDGVDLLFNTNKSDTGNKLDAMKELKDDPDNPFGSVVRQRIVRDEHGKERVVSAMNIVGSKEGAGEEGGWDTWSRTLSSQFLSKQKPQLAEDQLKMTYENRKADLDEIRSLTNPVVKKKLLEDFAESCDSAAVHLKAAKMPRQSTHVILPVNSLKETEVYAPNFRNGERVVLVRHPHGGIFELPELTVNNQHPESKKLLGSAKDAIAINPKVAHKLSGADFDGDTVLVIPNNKRRIETAPALESLKGFDPVRAYPEYPGMKKISTRTKEIQMGDISNLITDMTIKGAPHSEIARAVRHSMVVIDAEKHNLNYKQSAIDNGIAQLKEKYQGDKRGGASTLISRKKHEIDVPERKQSYRIDPATGKKIYRETGATTVDRRTGKIVIKTQKVKKILEVNDVRKMSSGTPIEEVYARHSNSLKDLANTARLESVHTKGLQRNPSAARAYSKEVDSLNSKLNLALRNRPLERQAQVLANTYVSARRQANPDMERDELKKLKSQALAEARTRTGARKQQIDITDSEWDAIQAGAISNHKLEQIMQNADADRLKALATPRSKILMTPTKVNRAKAMAAAGYTQAEIADALGVSLTTLKTSLSGG